MEVTVYPGGVQGQIMANPSKSAMQRAVAAALMARGHSVINNPCVSNDCLAALKVAEHLGAHVQRKKDRVEISSRGVIPQNTTVNCGESGLGIRMFTPIAALSDKKIIIKAQGSLVHRPVHFFEEVLPQLKVSCQTRQGKPPLTIKGPLKPLDITVDGSLSSQFLTGLLMAYGAGAENNTIKVRNLTSRPYIELTLRIMAQFGVTVEHENLEEFYFGHKNSYQAGPYTVEGDWSGAAFLLVAGAIGNEIEVTNLDLHSPQSDTAILEAIEGAGAKVTRKPSGIQVRSNVLKGFVFDATQCPDLFPPLVALAANCQGISKIKGVHRLTHKESNRSLSLQEEFDKMGIEITVENDNMLIQGGTIGAASAHSHNDHRIAMACATAAINADGPIRIEVAEAVDKSYPEFWDHWSKIGGKIEKNEV